MKWSTSDEDGLTSQWSSGEKGSVCCDGSMRMAPLVCHEASAPTRRPDVP